MTYKQTLSAIEDSMSQSEASEQALHVPYGDCFVNK